MAENLIELSGQIEKITFFNEENGFTIARLSVEGRRDSVTIVGNLVSPVLGQFIRAEGEWTRHPKFGEQFKVLRCESVLPFTLEGIEKYLASGLIKGIGPVMASRITRKFGTETLDIMEKAPERLLEIEGIGRVKLRGIKASWAGQKEIRNLILFLQDHAIGAGYAARIFKQYGANAVNILKSNPYRLASEVVGIGFLTADQIAAKLGFDRNSIFRIEAGILYTLNRLAESGHVYFPYEPLVRTCREMLQADEDLIERCLNSAGLNGKIVIEDRIAGRGVYLSGLHLAECAVADRMGSLLRDSGSARRADPGKALAWAQRKLDISLGARQIEAARCALTGGKVMVITGGPGTGKTTLIRIIVEVFSRSGLDICLAAPTGRAAKRMTEATGYAATTIHRLLEFSPARGGFQKNEDDPLKCDLLIVDEASMIDVVLMNHLLSALPDGTQLVLVGDINQLPSVGPGNILHDIIASGAVPVVVLDEIFRQARQSAIIMNAHRVLSGKMPDLSTAREGAADFYFIERNGTKEVLDTILEVLQHRIPARFGLNPVDDVQLISPMNKGELGTIKLNQELQAALNPSGKEINRGGRTLRIGDKVMQIRNNYERDVFNGDIGRVTGIDGEDQKVTVSFDGRKVIYDFEDLDEIAHAYAVSVHKSQGSEYPAVIIPVLTSHFIMLQRNLIYTAITRGKNLVVLIGSRKALAMGVKNEKTQERFTFLRQRLKDSW